MNRRAFLTTGTLATASFHIVRNAGAQAGGGADVNIALIGFGEQGRALVNATLQIPNVRFKAICDIWEYSRVYGRNYLGKMKHEVNAYEDFQELLAKEKDLQAVLVATPDFLHHEHTNACLKAGFHVYCEKMMSNSVENARSMVRTMKETGKLLQIGHQRRSNPRYIYAREKLLGEAKLCGRLTHANGQWNRSVAAPRGFPQKYAIPDETLKRFGFENMNQFRNWRWFKKFGGGPISDLGAHQIDIYNWFFGVNPSSVLAGGGLDYEEYKKLGYEYNDNVMAIFEYPLATGLARAFYQVLTSTGAGGGYFEYFMGDEGSIKISENPSFTRIFKEAAPDWKKWVDLGLLTEFKEQPAKPAEGALTDSRESGPPAAYTLPVTLEKPYHQPHLENFFDAIRGKGKLNCPADEAFHSEAVVFKVNEAVAAKQMLLYKPEDFQV